MNHRHRRTVHRTATALLLLLAGSLLAPSSALAEYLVVPGSSKNAVHLEIVGPSAWSVTAEVLSHPSWMTRLSLGYEPLESGPGVLITFDVDPSVRPGGTGTLVLSLTTRDLGGKNVVAGNVAAESGAGPMLRRVPLRLATAAPPMQRSFRIDECCLLASGIDGAMDGIPNRPVLLGSAPNPWCVRTAIRFGLPASGSVTLRVFNVAGSLQREIRAANLAPGYHEIPWDGRDPDGRPLPPGVYFYALSSDRWVTTGKTLLLR